jgi:putative FmdB family regulatory protein
MPTYEYECLNCKKIFEVFQQMSDEPLKKCPKCNKKIHRLIGGGSGVIFKGSGFYATDYRKPASKGSCSSDKKGCSDCPHAK